MTTEINNFQEYVDIFSDYLKDDGFLKPYYEWCQTRKLDERSENLDEISKRAIKPKEGSSSIIYDIIEGRINANNIQERRKDKLTALANMKMKIDENIDKLKDKPETKTRHEICNALLKLDGLCREFQTLEDFISDTLKTVKEQEKKTDETLDSFFADIERIEWVARNN